MTATSRRRLVWAVAVVAVLVAAGCGGDPSVAQNSAANPGGVVVSTGGSSLYRGAEPARPYQMPDVTLTATNNRDFNLLTDTGYAVTLFFYGYTHCPDVCPLVMSDLAQAMLQLPDSVRAQTQLIFITTDPARDTPSVLRSYLDHYNRDFVGLTGNLADILKASQDMGVAIEGQHRLASGGYDVAHGAQVIGFHDNVAPVIWTQGTPVADMVHDIETLAAS